MHVLSESVYTVAQMVLEYLIGNQKATGQGLRHFSEIRLDTHAHSKLHFNHYVTIIKHAKMETVDDIRCITKVKITLNYHYREYDKHVCNVNFTFNNCRRSQRFFQKKAFYGTIGLKPITTIYKLNYIHGRDICSGSVI